MRYSEAISSAVLSLVIGASGSLRVEPLDPAKRLAIKHGCDPDIREKYWATSFSHIQFTRSFVLGSDVTLWRIC